MKLVSKMQCCGCRSCEQKCPMNAIKITTDKEGFLNPKINSETCTNCGWCKKGCPALKVEEPATAIPLAYGVRYINDDSKLFNSASGGAFLGFAETIIQKGGWVFGAALNESLVCEHIAVNSIDKLDTLQGSKYVQSDTLNTYKTVSNLIKKGVKVLYSGCPCQIAGLYAYLGHRPDLLYTVDLACHGVASPLLFKKYIGWFEEKYKTKVLQYKFRTKYPTWIFKGSLQHTYQYNDTYMGKSRMQPYHYHYLKYNVYRRCCYECVYINSKRLGDVTIGDLVNISLIAPEVEDNRGVSAILVRTEQGKKLLEQSTPMFSVKEINYEKLITHHTSMVSSSPGAPPMRNEIYKKINMLNDYEYIQKELVNRIRLKDKFIFLLPHNLKATIKRLMRKSPK